MTMTPPKGLSHLVGRRVRRRLLWTFFAFGIGAGATWFYKADVFAFLLAPAGGMLSPHDGLPVYNSPVSMMGATIQLAMKGGIVTSLPVLTIGILTLLKPWLPGRLWRFLIIFIPISTVSFLTGAAFVYYVMLPVGLGFLLHFGEGIAVPMILISEYTNLLSSLMLWIGVVFELPVAMFLITKMDIISYRQFKQFRKFLPAAAYILAIVLTPTFDAINSTLVAVPIIVLYEVGLFVSWLADTDAGDYLFVKAIRRGIVWFVRRPVVILRWIQRKAVTHGLWWW